MSRRLLLTATLVFGAIAAVAYVAADLDLDDGSGTPIPLSFTDATVEAGLDVSPTLTWGSVWADHDLDGDPDLLANRHWHPPYLFENRRGTYVKLAVDLYPYLFDRHDCAWGEANGDGTPDLYCTQGADRGRGSGPNQLMIQDQGFVDRAAEFAVEDSFGRGRSVNWIDYDSDGDLDIFLGNKLREGYPNVMFRNDRGRFKPRDLGLARELNTSTSTWADWDGDSDPDLLVLQYEPGPAIAYENVEGRFEETSLPGISGEIWRSAAWGDLDGNGSPDLQLVREDAAVSFMNDDEGFRRTQEIALVDGRAGALFDYDNDGDLDSFIVQGDGRGAINQPDLLLAQAGGRFVLVADDSFSIPRTGSGESVAVADSDRDGRLDVIVSNGADTLVDDERVRGIWILWRNETEGGNWVAVDLHGNNWNPWGMGSEIRVESESATYRRQLTDGVTTRAQSDPSHLVLGIGSSRRASIEVIWPDGSRDCFEMQAGDTRSIEIGSEAC